MLLPRKGKPLPLVERLEAVRREPLEQRELLLVRLGLLLKEPETGPQHFAGVLVLPGVDLLFDEPIVMLGQVDVSRRHRLSSVLLPG